MKNDKTTIFFAAMCFIVLVLIVIAELFWENHLEKYQSNLEKICYDDAINLNVTFLSQYNGIFDINRKFDLKVNYLRLNEEGYHIIDEEDIVRLSKGANSSYITFQFKDGTEVTVEGEFNC